MLKHRYDIEIVLLILNLDSSYICVVVPIVLISYAGYPVCTTIGRSSDLYIALIGKAYFLFVLISLIKLKGRSHAVHLNLSSWQLYPLSILLIQFESFLSSVELLCVGFGRSLKSFGGYYYDQLWILISLDIWVATSLQWWCFFTSLVMAYPQKDPLSFSILIISNFVILFFLTLFLQHLELTCFFLETNFFFFLCPY